MRFPTDFSKQEKVNLAELMNDLNVASICQGAQNVFGSGVGQLDPRDGVRGMICANPDSQVSAAMRTIMELPILMAFARFSVSEYGNFKHWRQPANAHREQVHGMLYVEAHRLTPKWAAV